MQFEKYFEMKFQSRIHICIVKKRKQGKRIANRKNQHLELGVMIS